MEFNLEKFLEMNIGNASNETQLYDFLNCELYYFQSSIIKLLDSENNIGEELECNQYSIIKLKDNIILIRDDVGEENGVSIDQTRIVIEKDHLKDLIDITNTKGMEEIEKILKSVKIAHPKW